MQNHIGRTVQFRDKTGETRTGIVKALSGSYGTMELEVDGQNAVIRFPFIGQDTRFVDEQV